MQGEDSCIRHVGEPWLFNKMMRAPLRWLRERGVWLIFYSHYILIADSSPLDVRTHYQPMLDRFFELGWQPKAEKCVTTSSQEIDFLGFVINSVTMTC